MRFAVCMKNEELRERFAQLLERYRTQRKTVLDYLLFHSELDLCAKVSGGEFDAIFLDSSEGLAGLIVELRERDHRVRLIPVAGGQWAEAEYGSEVWYCLPALASEGFLFALLDRLSGELQREGDFGLVVKSRQGVVHILFSELEYVEVINKTSRFCLRGGGTVEVTAPLSDYEPKLLSWPDFIKVHRSYIVNLRHVQRLEPGSVVTQSGRTVPVSKYLYPELRRDYLCRLSDPGPVAEGKPKGRAPEPARDAYSILLVDDDSTELAYWSRVLEQRGCRVVCADCGPAALVAAERERFDGVLLDVMLGDELGFDLCGELGRLSGAPILFLSTKSDTDSQLAGFRSGGTDYITKDTSDELFWAKVCSRIGRKGGQALRFGPLEIDLSSHSAQLCGGELTLTTVEFDLLCLLAQHADEVCTPTEIYRSLWDGSGGDGEQTVQMQMSRLRRKLERACPDHCFIETVWGEGYRFAPPKG